MILGALLVIAAVVVVILVQFARFSARVHRQLTDRELARR